MLSEARSLPCFQLVFDVATFESSIDSVKLDLDYFKYSRSSLTEPIDDLKVTTSKTSWKHERLLHLLLCLFLLSFSSSFLSILFLSSSSSSSTAFTLTPCSAFLSRPHLC
uniref:Uncharacterized protein n=1 Tax=Ananas comosus var. bracteatus TaxID=296719 RepID=A0A6V7PXG1_ANACO|nr:unnamed protein product [Ananas comosus var. bracteatus]